MNRESTYGSASAGILLIGLGILFLVPGVDFWPWILAVVGLASLPSALATRHGWYGWQSAFWLIGLAFLFAWDILWPGILILAGLSAIIGTLTRGSEGSPFATEGTAPEDGEDGPPRPDGGSPTKRLS